MADVRGKIGESLQDRVSYQTRSDPKGSRVLIGAPDYRVFVWGVEITQDVVAVQIDQQMNESVSTAQLTVANDNEKWIVPNALNLLSLATFPDELSIPTGDNPLWTGSTTGTNTQHVGGSQATPFIPTPIKFAREKRANFMKAVAGARTADTPAFKDLLSKFSNSRNFPFKVGRPMIQMGDPVRIFLKNPWQLARRDIEEIAAGATAEVGAEISVEGVTAGGEPGTQEEWYFGLTGFCAVVTEDFDAKDNRSNLIIMCEGIKRLLRYMRTTTSPNVFNFNAIPDYVRANDAQDLMKKIAGDAILVSGNQAMQAGQKLVNTAPGPTAERAPGVTSGPGAGAPGIVDTLLFGDTGNLESLGFIVQGQQEGMQLIAGVLGFNPHDRTVALLQGTSGPEIEQALSTLMDRMYPQLTENDVERYGADWSLGSNAETAPEPNHLYIILPDKAGFGTPGQPGSADFSWPYDFAMRVDYFAEFRSRLDVINEFVQNIESVWYETPKGDIVLEFPQYDGLPFNFKAPWAQILQLRDEYTRLSATEDDRNLKTLTIAQGSPVPGLDSKGFPPIAIGRKFNPELAAMFGIREQRDSRPFKYSEDYANASLPTLAALWQELANADCYRLEGLVTTPNFRAPIAKPYFFAARNQIVYATGIHHQIAWASLAQTTYDFHYIRHFDADRGTWEKISGGFGWHWINNAGGGGVDQVTGSTGPTTRQTSIKTTDPMADQMDQFLQEVAARESVTGKAILTDNKKRVLLSITDQLRTERDPNRRQVLAGQANDIISRAKI